MTPLPAWADTPVARELIDAILADPPESYVRQANIFGPSHEKFSAGTPSGKLVCRLRRIHSEWIERQFAALDAQFHVSGHWDQAASNAIHRVEDADALIRRLLKAREDAERDAREERRAAA